MNIRQRIAEAAPPFCECARTAHRSLSWAGWVPGLSKNRLSDSLDLEFSHHHIFFDQSEDNLGFGPHGLFEERRSDWDYRSDETCYDGELMRKAIETTSPPSIYLFIGSNCQRYVDKVLETYDKLKRKAWGDR